MGRLEKLVYTRNTKARAPEKSLNAIFPVDHHEQTVLTLILSRYHPVSAFYLSLFNPSLLIHVKLLSPQIQDAEDKSPRHPEPVPRRHRRRPIREKPFRRSQASRALFSIYRKTSSDRYRTMEIFLPFAKSSISSIGALVKPYNTSRGFESIRTTNVAAG